MAGAGVAEGTGRHRHSGTQCLGKSMDDFPAHLAQRPLRIAPQWHSPARLCMEILVPVMSVSPFTMHLPRQDASPQGGGGGGQVYMILLITSLKVCFVLLFVKKKEKKKYDYLIHWEHLQKMTLHSPRLLWLLTDFLFIFPMMGTWFRLLRLSKYLLSWIPDKF